MRPLQLLAVVTALILVSAEVTRAAEGVWSGLVIANNVPQPEPIPSELKKLEGTLKGLFGYNQFKVIGQSQETLKTGAEDWNATSKYFALRVNAKGKEEGAYLLNVRLFQEAKLLLEMDTRFSKSSPLVIKGPMVGDGQLLLVLVVQ